MFATVSIILSKRSDAGRLGQGDAESRRSALGYPIWASDISPMMTGKWRIEAQDINGEIMIGDERVVRGDLAVADDSGICIIPRDLVLEVVEAAEHKTKAETAPLQGYRRGLSAPGIARATYGKS